MDVTQEFHRFEDGHVEVVGEWLPRMLISAELLTPEYLARGMFPVEVEGDLVTFMLSNGTATYRRAGRYNDYTHWYERVPEV